MKSIYLDNAATTKVDPEVVSVMKPYFGANYGNASEYHALGRQAKAAIENAREKIADFLGSDTNEIIFTGSATESINLSHKGLIEALNEKKPHIIISQIEHKAVLETCRHLEKNGLAEVTYLPVNKWGQVELADVLRAIRPETVLISLMYVNNEVGTVQPIMQIGREIAKINQARHQKIYFHTDATQAVQYFDCKVDNLGVDLLSFTGHKIYAPKGIGSLFVREGTPLVRQLDGGGQESGMRASTENVPYVVALGKAIELTSKSVKSTSDRIRGLRDYLIKEALKIPNVELTGHPVKRVPHIASFIVKGIEGEALVLKLSNLGIYASSGSACTTSDLTPSHVLTAMGVVPEESHGSIRFSLGKGTTGQEIDYLVGKLPTVISELRKMAPDI